MRGLIKLLVALGLLMFTTYTFYVEPNAADDPAGAISKATERLSTVCDRNREECNFLSDFGEGVGQATSIGWKLVTGQGRLVYVADDGSSTALSTRGFGGNANRAYGGQAGAPSSGSSLGDLIRSTTLFGGGGSNGSAQRYSQYCN